MRAYGARRRVPIGRYLFVKGENPPFHTFPRTRRQRTEFAAICFFRAQLTAAHTRWCRRQGNADLRSASRGSAKPAPTTLPPANLTAANPRIANRAESRGAWSAGLRPASRGSAKPAQRPPANLTAKPTHRQPRKSRGAWSAGLRPASRGSAKPAPTTPPPANLTATNPRIANRTESRGHGAPVSDRHRAGARNPHQRRRATPISRLQTHASPTAQNHGERGAPVSDRHRAGARNPPQRPHPPPISRLERRSPTGIARERETRTNNTTPYAHPGSTTGC